jgi:pimeloyl-ACP methyl ester carboxylesterase
MDREYPYKDPYLATATFALLKGSEERSGVYVDTKIVPGRDRIPQLDGRGYFKFAMFRQRGPAPVIFMIPGVGGHFTDGSSKYLAELFFRHGYHVLSLVSPLHWSFTLTASSSGVPGLPAADAHDLLRTMKVALAHLRSTGARVTRQGLVGWSLGALEAAHVAAEAEHDAEIHLDSVVMINPPVDLDFGVKQIDEMYQEGDSWTPQARQKIEDYAVQMLMHFWDRDVNSPDYFRGLDQIIHLNTQQIRYLIGWRFRETLQDTVFVTQQIHDRGFLPTRDPYNRVRRLESGALSYRNYIDQVVLPQWNETHAQVASASELNKQSGLHSLEGFLRQASQVVVLHNTNDPLVTGPQLAWLKSVMGTRAELYSYGGHLGNVWFPRNRDAILQRLEPLKKSR